MASVKVNSGEVTATLLARDVPQEKWPELVKKREWFSQVSLTHDCRMVVRFVQEADQMWKALGYASADDLIARGYGLEPDEIRLVVEWLTLNDPDEAVGLDDVKSKIRREYAEGTKTQAEIAAEHGISQPAVSRIITSKKNKQHPARNDRTVYLPREPSAAAARIRERLGDSFADGLKAAL
jgi:hypothetical protein